MTRALSEPPHPAATATFSPQTGRRYVLCLSDRTDRVAILMARQGDGVGDSWTRKGNAPVKFFTHEQYLGRARLSLLPVCGEKVAVAAG